MEAESTNTLQQLNENLGAQVGDLVRRRHELERRLRQAEQEAATARAELEAALRELEQERAQRAVHERQLGACFRLAGEILQLLDRVRLEVGAPPAAAEVAR